MNTFQVNYWKKRIASLSKPVTVPSSAPRPHELRRQRDNVSSRHRYFPPTSSSIVPPMARLRDQRRNRRSDDEERRAIIVDRRSVDDSGLCTRCWEPTPTCKCGSRCSAPVLCRICFDVPCNCAIPRRPKTAPPPMHLQSHRWRRAK